MHNIDITLTLEFTSHPLPTGKGWRGKKNPSSGEICDDKHCIKYLLAVLLVVSLHFPLCSGSHQNLDSKALLNEKQIVDAMLIMIDFSTSVISGYKRRFSSV